jgi:hypothetical protein
MKTKYDEKYIDLAFKKDEEMSFLKEISSLSQNSKKIVVTHAIYYSSFSFLEEFLLLEECDIKLNFEELFNFHYARKTQGIAILIKYRKIEDCCYNHALISILDPKFENEALYIFNKLNNTELSRIKYSNTIMYTKYNNLINVKQKIKGF